MPLSGNGAIRLTTARYYTPAGTSIQAKGIVPDIEVHQANVETVDDAPDRREADLRGRLQNDQDGETQQQPEAPGATPEATPAPPPEATAVPADSKEDYQLSRALDLLRGISLYESRGAAVTGSRG
jgi:carboxyl-terminal processing protease